MIRVNQCRFVGCRIVAAVAVCAACGSTGGEDEALEFHDDGSNVQGPKPGEISYLGRRFAPITSFSASELDAIQDPDMFAKPDTLQRTAMRWRLQMMKDDMHYVEVELNYALAKEVLELGATEEAAPRGGSALPAREGRIIKGSDNRGFATQSTGVVYESIAMSEAGGSGALIRPTKLYTAAHIVYRNIPFPSQSCSTPGVCGWICSNNAAWTSTNGCGTATLPRWRFGMGSGTSQNNPVAETNWITGPTFVLLTAFTVSPTTLTAYDYAAVDFSVGTFSSAPAVGTHLGWVALSDTQASNQGSTFWQTGYPARSNCPTNAVGDNMDCGTGTLEVGPTEFTRPYNWGEVMFTGQDSISPGTTSPSTSWGSNVDITNGHSGGPLVTWWTGGCSGGCVNGWYVVGTASNHGTTSDKNRFARVTGALSGWL